MSRAAICFAFVLLAGCSKSDQERTRQDAAQLGHDLKRDAKDANAVVTKEALQAREKVQDEAAKAKRELDKPKPNPQ